MPASHSLSPSAPRSERGVALILTLLVMTILFVVILQLKYSTAIKWTIARNQQDDVVMDLVARGCLERARAMLIIDFEDDVAAAEDEAAEDGGASGGGEGEGGGGIGGMGGGIGGGALGGEEEGGTGTVDSLDEEWASDDNVPTLGSEAEVRVSIQMIDEDRKFNLMQIFTPDVEDEEGRNYRERARERLVRLLDFMREGHLGDLDAGEAESLVEAIVEWIEGADRNERDFPAPPLKTNEPPVDEEGEPVEESVFDDEDKIYYPMTLEELMMVPGIDEDLFYGFVEDDEWVPGLRDVLTIYTVVTLDDPPDSEEEDVFAGFGREPGSDDEEEEGEEGGEGSEGEEEGSGGPITNLGRININTAPEAVLLCLMPNHEFGETRVRDFLEWRDEQLEEIRERIDAGEDEFGADLGGFGSGGSSLFGDEDPLSGLEGEATYPIKSLDDLDQLEFMADTDQYRDGEEPKEEWKSYLTTKSHIFTINVIVWKPNRDRVKVLSSVVWRYQDVDETRVIPIIPIRELSTRGIDMRKIQEAREDEEDI